ncbi:AMP-binding protein [Variovorax sp. J31P179]|uniref:AMP-dependent synthetase/ligase n=1 Tax=Variovorax sp. J31P179 TaxID=3053508 RepID=UPI0025789986|nr:AMP-binding protein [Variovorax sp. J31P179]MDM0082236.1 AMP-binding protein [Variovorax sp. J31P179]
MSAAATMTLPQAWLARCRAQPDQVAMRHKRRGIWRAVTWSEFFAQAQAIGLALDRLGLVPGEVVSIISESRPEWLHADMAAQAMGFVSHGVYPTCSARRVGRHLADAGSRVAFVENAAQAAKVLASAARLPRLARVVAFDERGVRELGDARVVGLAAFLAADEAAPAARFEARIAAGQGGDTAFLAGTAGTTGTPRLAAFSQAAAMRQGAAVQVALGTRDGDRSLCFVPLASAAERILAAVLPVLGHGLVHFPESPATVANDLREVEPHWVHAPPRFWEKLQARTESAALLTAPRERRLYRRSIDGTAGGWLAQAARRHVRRSLGLARARQVFSGGALAAPALAQWYGAIGVPLVDLYESAETCGPCLLGPSVARIAGDGELQLRPVAPLAGYWREGALQPPALTHDGWLHTGDLAVAGEDGVPRVVGRLSESFAMASGDRVAPGAIEAALLASSYIAGAMLVGEQRSHCACLVALEEESVLSYAQAEGIPFTDYANLVGKPEVHALVQAQIDRLNAALAEGRRIRGFGVLARTLSAQDEELTPALRIQRQMAQRSFSGQIEALYA